MKHAVALVAIAAFIGAATAQDKKTDASKAAAAKCAEQKPPAELLKKDNVTGTGAEVRSGTPVLVHYTGWLFDACAPEFKGKKFDSSVGRPVPFGVIVGVGKVIKGWDEGLVGMKAGGKRTLIIPPSKGYGERGAGETIPPNATLIFDVELVQVINQPAAQAPQKPK